MMQVNWLVIIWEFTQIERQRERDQAGSLKGLLSVTPLVVRVLCFLIFWQPTKQSKSLF